MSPFEQQVAEALKDLHTQWAFSSTDFEFSNLLAPRVAAAIAAAREAAHDAHEAADVLAWSHGARFTDDERAAQVAIEEQAALAALRGTPDP